MDGYNILYIKNEEQKRIQFKMLTLRSAAHELLTSVPCMNTATAQSRALPMLYLPAGLIFLESCGSNSSVCPWFESGSPLMSSFWRWRSINARLQNTIPSVGCQRMPAMLSWPKQKRACYELNQKWFFNPKLFVIHIFIWTVHNISNN